MEGSIVRKLWRSERSASSRICPASSHPVGPAPTTTKVSHRRFSSGSSSSSASSNAPKMRRRSSRASSIVFMPGAKRSNWSLPKYDVRPPAATMRLSYGNLHALADRIERAKRCACRGRSPVTSASSTRQLRAFLVTSRERRTDLALGEDAGGDLVQQRLEEVVVVPVDQGDVDRRHRQRLGGEEPAEAATDDDDAMASVQRRALRALVETAALVEEPEQQQRRGHRARRRR